MVYDLRSSDSEPRCARVIAALALMAVAIVAVAVLGCGSKGSWEGTWVADKYGAPVRIVIERSGDGYLLKSDDDEYTLELTPGADGTLHGPGVDIQFVYSLKGGKLIEEGYLQDVLFHTLEYRRE